MGIPLKKLFDNIKEKQIVVDIGSECALSFLTIPDIGYVLISQVLMPTLWSVIVIPVIRRSFRIR
ncbi:MAG: hypothetical protein CVV33_03365 [Methanomicrobiales archaeon HGW-Methanomicrobiales-4]|nr:MAG: hypothetical protein CVV33_03365 [Methanomicrobiales archaeon HGW-Methanomicrobiales-4]